MSFKYPNQEKTRDSRILGHTKGFSPKIVRSMPSSAEGREGDIAFGYTHHGVKLFIKLSSRWHQFSADGIKGGGSSVENFNPSTNGTTAIPNKVLGVNDSGKTFVINIGTHTVVFKLPPVNLSAGVEYMFIMSVDSDAEATKDFIVITNTNSEDMQGPIIHSGTTVTSSVIITKVTTATSKITWDSSTSNAPISAGDFLKFICDGKNWYLTGMTKYNNDTISDTI
jgi:hypothetical protein